MASLLTGSMKVKGLLILDTEGKRICCKYFSKDMAKPEKQVTFEKDLISKTKLTNSRSDAEVIMMGRDVVLYTNSSDCYFYVIGSSDSNELVLATVLDTLYEAVSALLKQQIDKVSMLENLELILLAMDEIVDEGVIFETDSMKVANRVLMDEGDSDEEGGEMGGRSGGF